MKNDENSKRILLDELKICAREKHFCVDIVHKRVCSNLCRVRTWIKFVINIGSIERGKRRMLNSDKLTKAFVASKTLFSSTKTYVANVLKATCCHPVSQHNIKS